MFAFEGKAECLERSLISFLANCEMPQFVI